MDIELTELKSSNKNEANCSEANGSETKETVEPPVHSSNEFGNAMCCLPFIDLAYLGRKYTFYSAKVCNHFMNQVDLMHDVTPVWAYFLSRYKAYGHFSFVNKDSNDVIVRLNVFSEQNTFDHSVINRVFEPYGCRVEYLNIKYLNEEEQREQYHNQYLHHPLDNQRYQMFLLGLENRVNWITYIAIVDDWESLHFIQRYLTTHLTAFLDQISEPIDSEALAPWLYIFKAFRDVGFTSSDMRMYYTTALNNNHDIGLVEYLLLKTYE